MPACESKNDVLSFESLHFRLHSKKKDKEKKQEVAKKDKESQIRHAYVNWPIVKGKKKAEYVFL